MADEKNMELDMEGFEFEEAEENLSPEDLEEISGGTNSQFTKNTWGPGAVHDRMHNLKYYTLRTVINVSDYGNPGSGRLTLRVEANNNAAQVAGSKGWRNGDTLLIYDGSCGNANWKLAFDTRIKKYGYVKNGYIR